MTLQNKTKTKNILTNIFAHGTSHFVLIMLMFTIHGIYLLNWKMDEICHKISVVRLRDGIGSPS